MKKFLIAVSLVIALAATNAVCRGNAEFDASRNISITAREDGSGTKTAFMEIIGLKGKADPASVIIQTGTAGVLAEPCGYCL